MHPRQNPGYAYEFEMGMLSVNSGASCSHGGVTSLGDEVFLLRRKERDQVEVYASYDAITYCIVRYINVPDLRGLVDMTSCEHYRCLYISDHVVMCIHRVDVQGATIHWPVNDEPFGLSVTKAHNVLVTCDVVRKIKEFSSHGHLLREMTLPDDVINPWHAMQLTSGQFIVSHGSSVRDDPIHRVCLVSADGGQIIHSHGGLRGSNTGQYDGPIHLAVDDNEFVFVVDHNNQRVTLLSPTLNYIRQLASGDKLKWDPCRLHLDVQRRRLYVAVNKWKDDMCTSGCVVVLGV